MELNRAGTRAAQAGPPKWFTGQVRIEFLNTPPSPSRVGVASVWMEQVTEAQYQVQVP